MLIILASTRIRIPDIIFFTCAMSYYFFTLTLALIVIPFLCRVTFSTIKFTFILTWDVFWKRLWFIYSFDYVKVFNVYIDYFNRNTYSTKRIINSITTSTTFIKAINKLTYFLLHLLIKSYCFHYNGDLDQISSRFSKINKYSASALNVVLSNPCVVDLYQVLRSLFLISACAGELKPITIWQWKSRTYIKSNNISRI